MDIDSDDEVHEFEPDPLKITVHWEKSSKSKNDRGVQVNFVRVESFGLWVEVREPNILHK